MSELIFIAVMCLSTDTLAPCGPLAAFKYEQACKNYVTEQQRDSRFPMKCEWMWLHKEERYMTHVMIDCETWGTAMGSAIRSLSARTFLHKGTSHVFTRNIIRSSCVAAGLTIDPQTEEWWTDPARAEAAVMLELDPESIFDVLPAFSAWLTSVGAEYIWSHGASFDIPLLKTAYDRIGLDGPPWDFRKERDTRTLFHLANLDPKTVPFVGTPHVSVHDVNHQIKCVLKAWYRLHPPLEIVTAAEELADHIGPHHHKHITEVNLIKAIAVFRETRE